MIPFQLLRSDNSRQWQDGDYLLGFEKVANT